MYTVSARFVLEKYLTFLWVHSTNWSVLCITTLFFSSHCCCLRLFCILFTVCRDIFCLFFAIGFNLFLVVWCRNSILPGFELVTGCILILFCIVNFYWHCCTTLRYFWSCSACMLFYVCYSVLCRRCFTFCYGCIYAALCCLLIFTEVSGC